MMIATWAGTFERSISVGIFVGRGSGTGKNLVAATDVASTGTPNLAVVRTFDPDDDDPYVADVEAPSVDVRDDVLAAVADRAVATLDAVTHDLPGGGESRTGQRDMVRAVAAAGASGRHLVIEAGTGVGKSLGYLVPLSLTGERVVVATATKNLQDQLATKDAPLVAAHHRKLKVAVLKGRANYLCRLRVRDAGGDGQLALDVEESPATVSRQVRRILEWARTTETGERDELSFEADGRAWRAVSVSPHECVGRVQCPEGERCFAERAKDRAAEADIVIVNTHLYGAHLSAGSSILPEHDCVVFDEAHQVPDIFAQLLGTTINAATLRTVASQARAALTGAGVEPARSLLSVADRLGDALARQLGGGQATGLNEEVATLLAEASGLVTELLARLRDQRPDQLDALGRYQRALGPTVHLGTDLARIREATSGELVWLAARDRDVDIELSLVELGPRLAKDLWSTVRSVLTSATIHDTLVSELGLTGEAEVMRVPSPFDYATHSLLYVPSDLPHRNDGAAEAAIIEELVALITAANGRTLALFTNREVMKRVAALVETRIATPVLVQDTLSRNQLLKQFRDDHATSLFAVTSYWQGVDVPGSTLSLVTIDRLPFARPDDPLTLARRERAGDRAFTEVDLPRAAMLLAQGVGRLIRSHDDQGVVAVLDTRLATANYRGRLLGRLPPMRRTRSRAEVEQFLRELPTHVPAAGTTSPTF
jgi:ATP-dependent DNA helicase DinG